MQTGCSPFLLVVTAQPRRSHWKPLQPWHAHRQAGIYRIYGATDKRSCLSDALRWLQAVAHNPNPCCVLQAFQLEARQAVDSWLAGACSDTPTAEAERLRELAARLQ
jgi:hypothetical protein